MMIDTHCHLSKLDYSNLDQIIKNMGNNIMIVSGANTEANIEVLELCSKYNNIYGVIGIHPEEISDNIDESLELLEKNINNPKIVGIGEIGLDYYYRKDNQELQKDVFIRQLNLAKKYNKSVVIHSRDAIQDTYDILKKYTDLKIDIHCFSGSLEMALKFTQLGCRLGIGGVLTFKNSEKLKEVVKNVEMKYLLLETDSPYLTPEPFRGKQNEPYNVYYVAEKIAELKNISLDKVLDETTNNAINQFDLNKFL